MNETNKFPLVSGNLSLDLVNTELVRRGQREDLLLSEKDVLDWLHVVKEENTLWNDLLLLKAEERIERVVTSILDLRYVLRTNLELVAEGKPIPDLFIAFLEEKIAKAPFTYKIINQTLISIPVGEIEDMLISLISFNALTLIGENKMTHLKRCSNLDCVLLFIDQSGRRKWCSMKICGNRKKVARFQQRSSDEALGN